MSGDAVLIAAFSGRSLAQSARRAGYKPFVVDAFGDLDTQEAAEDFHVLDGAMQTGFRTKPLVAALNDLSQSARTPPVGLVLGSGLEDKPRLVAALASRFRLLGPGAETLAACKDPKKFFSTLDKLRVVHPETQTEPPSSPHGWISKRIGGSGGRHIRDCVSEPKAKARRYFQKRLDGTRYSVGALFGIPAPSGGFTSSFRLTRQWRSPSSTQPYRFGGCVSHRNFNSDLQELADIAGRVGSELQLKGMASFDFIVRDGTPFLLEVNPRPGASLDVLDDAAGDLFRAHMAAWTQTDDPAVGGAESTPKAMAILHADRGALTLGETPWPDWSADRGAPGTFVPLGAPLATAFAEAQTADAAEALALARLAELEDLIYGHAKA